MIATTRPEQISALNILPGVVHSISEHAKPAVDVTISCNGEMVTARLTRFSVDSLDLGPGTPVFAIVKSVTFDRHTLFGRAAAGPED
jgi:molybdate transport system ATP-binding protein